MKKKHDYHIARKRMVEEQLLPGGVQDPRVLEVMSRLPRHLFVEKGLADQAYLDRPINIGFGQTISQPLIVGLMTQALELKGEEKVLEIGTGSGYQTAIFAELTKKVYSIERIADLSIRARKTLYRLNYYNIEFKIGDGTLGWSEAQPFDVIMITAGGPKLPEPLKNQLAEEGRIIAPVGTEESQQLVLLKKIEGEWKSRVLSECRFVKLIGQEGWMND